MHRVLAVLSVLMLLSLGVAHAAITVNGDLSDWGTWGTSTDGSASFAANSNVQFKSIWDQTDNHITASNSGAEWFDIEGLYVRFTQPDTSHTYLNWAIVTSHPGLEPYYYNSSLDSPSGDAEWRPTFGTDRNATNDGVDGGTGNNGYLINGNGPIASERNGGNNLNRNPSHFVFHRNPVIGLNLDNVDGYEYGLVLANNSVWGTGDFSNTAPILYSIANPGTTWVAGTDFPTQQNAVDFNVNATGVTSVATNGSCVRKVGYSEDAADQTVAAGWRMDYNWYWEGSLDVSSLITTTREDGKIDLGGQYDRYAHYALWCGNDGVADTLTEKFNGNLLDPPDTPELSTWVLLSCTGLFGLWGFGWRRRDA